jgi:hypothetical protein
MDNIDQVNMDNQLPESSIQPVIPDVNKDNDVYDHVMSQPTKDVIKSKAVLEENQNGVDRFYRKARCTQSF